MVLILNLISSFVETKGRTLEEINEIFKAPYPKARSLATHAVLVDEDRGILYQAMQDQDELWSTGDTGETS